MSMVPVVAEAIWLAEWDEPLPPQGTIQHGMAMQMARAAIEAMRVPTIGMVEQAQSKAVAHIMANPYPRDPGAQILGMWQAAIDAALAEPSGVEGV